MFFFSLASHFPSGGLFFDHFTVNSSSLEDKSPWEGLASSVVLTSPCSFPSFQDAPVTTETQQQPLAGSWPLRLGFWPQRRLALGTGRQGGARFAFWAGSLGGGISLESVGRTLLAPCKNEALIFLSPWGSCSLERSSCLG